MSLIIKNIGNFSNIRIEKNFFSSWTPSNLYSNNQYGVWYDPSDLSTLFQDTAGTIAITADGQSVALMKDKSGNNFDAVQTSTERRPIYRTNGTLHWLEFDGTDDYMDMSLLSFANDFMIGIAAKLVDYTSQTNLLGHTTKDTKLSAVSSNLDVFFRAVELSGTASADTTDHTSELAIWTATRDDLDYLNIRLRGTSEATSSTPESGTSEFNALGGSYDVGRDNLEYFLNGAFYGLWVVENHTVDDITKVEGYSSHKLSIESSLPSDHPYKNNTPTT